MSIILGVAGLALMLRALCRFVYQSGYDDGVDAACTLQYPHVATPAVTP